MCTSPLFSRTLYIPQDPPMADEQIGTYEFLKKDPVEGPLHQGLGDASMWMRPLLSRHFS